MIYVIKIVLHARIEENSFYFVFEELELFGSYNFLVLQIAKIGEIRQPLVHFLFHIPARMKFF